jgi:hypothetical protein
MAESKSGIPDFEEGQVLLSTGDVQVMKIDLTSTHIDVDLEDKAFIKRIIAMREDLARQTPGGAAEANEPPTVGGGALSTACRFAEALRSRGITITFSYKGKRVATIGAEANPRLLHRITKTKGIAINSVFTAIRMVI